MADLYESLLSNNVGRSLLNSLNLPVPTPLERHSSTQTSFLSGNVLVGAAPGGRMLDVIAATLKQSNATALVAQNAANIADIKQAGDKAELKFTNVDPA
ncbi:MAG TPA: short chain dehydrogenase, partial [Candidatus Kapabacteria bacterium]|nr:short chain dehydrogenase [Candidatus Kapabacteria bacterium]